MSPIEFIDKELESKGFWNEINENDERLEEICERYEPEGGKNTISI